MKQGFPETSNYKVIVQCITYNQSKYIEDTLKGFAMQQTNFPFICCIFDDASTDGEQEVLKRWIENHCNYEDIETYDHPLTIILMAPDKDNPNCIYAVHLQKVNTWGKPEKQDMMSHWEKQCEYIALCEGDDYWIDPLKLQKQCDFMEKHTSHSLCFCAHYNLIEDDLILQNRYDSDVEICDMEDIILGGGGFMATNSMFYRKQVIENRPSWYFECVVGDCPTMLILAARGLVGYIHEPMCVYRISATNSWSERMKNSWAMRSKHHRNIQQMWLNFDRWTAFKYNSIIKQKMSLNNNNYKWSVLYYLYKTIFK